MVAVPCHGPRKTLFLEAGEGRGGSTHFLYDMLRSLTPRRWDPVVVYYFYNEGPDTKRIRDLGIPVEFLCDRREPEDYVPIRFLLGESRWRWLHTVKVALRFGLRMILYGLPQMVRLRRLLRVQRIGLIVFNNDVHLHSIGVLAAKVAHTPCVCRKTGGIGEGTRLKALLAPWVDVFVPISRATELDQIRTTASTRRIVTIPEGVDLHRFSYGAKSERVMAQLGIPPGQKVLGSIARLEPGKGQEDFLRACAIVLDRQPNVTCLVVGDADRSHSEYAKRLQELAAQLGIQEHVVFTGWREDVPEVLSVLDVFVHCPTTFIEGLGIATLEAMASGKPCVVYDNGGLSEVVVEGSSGFVVPIGQVQQLADRILALVEDDDLSRRVGLAARERAEREYDIVKNVRTLEDLLEEYASSGRSATRA